MKKVVVIMALALFAGGVMALDHMIIKCDKDSYTSLSNPDTNYGSATQLDSQVKYSYSGSQFSNLEIKMSYFHYGIPENLIGKVKAVEGVFYYYIGLYKGNSPYKAGQTNFSAGLYPLIGTWDEYTLTFNNQPSASGPGYFSVDTLTGTYKPVVGWNKFVLDREGLRLLQKTIDKGDSYGMACYVDIAGPQGQTLMAGDYLHLLRIVSRETTKKMPYIQLTYEVITGKMVNGTNVTPSTLGEVKALYR